MRFGSVAGAAERVLIVCTGPSMTPDLLPAVRAAQAAGVYVIAVNAGIVALPSPTAWFTLDPNLRCQAFMHAPRRGVRFYAAVPADFGTPAAALPQHRTPPRAHMIYLERCTGAGPFGARAGLAEDVGAIHTGNSGYGALGLAYHLRPARVGILGLDATDRPYAIAPGRPAKSLEHLPWLFGTAAPQLRAAGIEVLLGSPSSRVRCFERTAPEIVLDWLAEATPGEARTGVAR